MCTISMIMDDWRDRTWPRIQPVISPQQPDIPDLEKLNQFIQAQQPTVSREEFNALKQEIESLKKLLQAAKIYDRESGQPDCELEEKIALFKQLANILGVEVSDLFPEKTTL